MNSSLKKQSVLQGMNKSRSMLVGNVGKSGYFLGIINNAGNGNNGQYSITTDASNDIYLAGLAPSSQVSMTKITANPLVAAPAISWDRGYASANGFGIAIDSAGNYYSGSEDGGNSRSALVKFNSAGTVLWSRGITPQGTVRQVVTTSGDSVIMVAQTPYNPGDGNNYLNFQINQYNSSGTLQWQRRYYKGSAPYYNAVPFDTALDSSDQSHTVGYSLLGGTNWDAVIIKLDSSGNLAWQRYMAGTASDGLFFFGVGVDSGGNAIAGGSNGGTNSGCYLVKFNGSGGTTFQKNLKNGGQFNDVAVDASNNYYAVGYAVETGFANTVGLIAKYNSSGTLQWQRYIAVNNGQGYDYIQSVKIDSAGNVCITGQIYGTTGNQMGLVGKLAADGSGTGTYTIGADTIIYGVATGTETTPTYANNAATLTGATTGSSSNTVTYTLSNITRTLTTSGVL